MKWDRQDSADRIERFMQSVPASAVSVSRFDAMQLANRRMVINSTKATTGQTEDFIFGVRPSQAIIVDGVHVYVHLLDYADKMLDQNRETEAAHARVLGMLHLHYSACDTLAERFEAQRVDYHGPRMHAVIVSPADGAGEQERINRALEFADAVKRTIEAASRDVGNGEFRTRVRIGIDSGLAVAVNSGRASEPEPLFLGNPANQAAKLAEGSEDGIYVSERVRTIARLGELQFGLTRERVDMSLRVKSVLAQNTAAFGDNETNAAVSNLKALLQEQYGVEAPRFTFHHTEPPLSGVKFSELFPSNAVRMELVSIFADLSGFTKYVDRCIAEGRVQELVVNLHVIRMEMAATLKEDFGGKKVRFIGDCLHGLIAMGTSRETDGPASVKAAVHAAGGVRSSFELCQEYLPGTKELGLAIGLEFGVTPMCRLGLRGARSIRCSASKAVSRSEELQSACEGKNGETAIGARALSIATANIRQLFDENNKAYRLDYDAAVGGTITMPAVVTSGNVSQRAQPHSK